MLDRLLCLLILGAVLAACGNDDDDAAYDETTVRVFAVGHKQELSDALSYETYREKMVAVMEWIAPDFSEERPNLVVLGEDIGLIAAFIGSRGEFARTTSDAVSGFGGIAGEYIEIVQDYQAQWPEVSLNRAVTLALTDVMARAFFETFPPLAQEYNVYLSACTLLAPTRTSDDPADIAFYGDPDIDEEFVYIADAPEVYNTCWIWGPDGAELLEVRKVNLVALEQDLLMLAEGELEDVAAAELPFGRVSIAISKDAFITSYLDRLEGIGAQIVLQNDANPGAWTATKPETELERYEPGTLLWQPQAWEESTLRMVTDERFSTIAYNVCPMMVGNLLDIPFDGQSSITARHVPADHPERFYVGNEPSRHFLALGPWTFEDPVIDNPELSLEERREWLAEQNEKLLPGSGHPRENDYVASYVFADLDVNAE